MTEIWDHHDNLQKYLFDKLDIEKISLSNFMKTNVIVTDKIDGSNLAIWVRWSKIGDLNDVNSWEIVALQGRNQIIWPTKNHKGVELQIEELPLYGNAINLNKLPYIMKEFAVYVANSLNIFEISVFGEVFRANKLGNDGKTIETISRFASWHPFGIKLPDKGWECSRLNKHLYDIFVKTSLHMNMPFVNNHDSMINILIDAKKHYIFPPSLYFTGKLCDAIKTLYPILKESNDPLFEGFFIIFEEINEGAKWKSKYHDEQGRIHQIEDFNEFDNITRDHINMILDIWKSKVSVRLAKFKSNISESIMDVNKKHILIIENDIQIAFDRELYKNTSFTHIPKKDRKPTVDKMLKLVITEVINQYSDSNIELPISITSLNDIAKKKVNKFVMQIPYINNE
jgi:hypothetical protein